MNFLIFPTQAAPFKTPRLCSVSSMELLQSDDIAAIASLLSVTSKLFPSQRRAIFEKLSGASVSGFVANVTTSGVEDVMLRFLPPRIFKRHLKEVAQSLDSRNLSDAVSRFPPALVTNFYYFYLPNNAHISVFRLFDGTARISHRDEFFHTISIVNQLMP